eukprot:gb/GFBE01073361.1/.p1 GENE.gb/GFBE01073361.1/~~gb/GFBE01073361.1/.p1  ORF type:complete len:189 (+),score=22.63 gb/GFBE01073361.1/:1-567(+)
MSGAMTERGNRPPKLPGMPSPGGPAAHSGAVTERSAFAKRTTEEAGVNYLKGSRVGSVTGYISVAGNILGRPHPGRRAKSGTPRARFDAVSEQAARFREMPYCYASMDRKPLMPYDPNAFRSRLAVDDAPVPYKNSSTIEFSDGIHTCHKRRFQTTNSTFYTGEPCDPRSNAAVIADEVRFRRFMQAK